jgi:hypothetical protein
LLIGVFVSALWGANRQILGLFHDDGIYTIVTKSLTQGAGYRIISLPGALPQTSSRFSIPTFCLGSGLSTAIFPLLASRSPVADEAIQRRLDSTGVQAQSRGPIRLHDDEETTMWERVANFFFGDKEMPDRFSGISPALASGGLSWTPGNSDFLGSNTLFLCMALGFGAMLLAWISEPSMKDFLMLSGFAALVGYMLPFITIYRKAIVISLTSGL